MAIYVPEGASGYFEDLSHSDTVSTGDLLDYGIVAAENGNGNSLGVDWIGAHFLASTPSQCMIGGAGDNPTLITGSISYFNSLFGAGDIHTGLADRSTGLLPYDLTASNYTNYITDADMGTGVATFALVNGGTSVLCVTSGSSLGGMTGYITDTDTANFAAGDTCTNSVTLTSGTGTNITWASAALLLQAS